MSALLREEWIARYRSQIGRDRCEVTTPALLLDLDAARRNLAVMSARGAELGVALRPHVKAHKSAELARLQLEAGAVGLTCATVWEAVVMAGRAGADDLLIANQVAGPEKLAALGALACGRRIGVAVDAAEGVRALAASALAAGCRLELLVEVDVGMGRAGVRSAAEALELAALIEELPGVRFRGVHGYEGHCLAEPDPATCAACAARANRVLSAVVEALEGAGHACEVVSAGGTATYATTGTSPVVGELQVGSYVLMDVFHERLVPDQFETALSVLGTVVSRQGSTAVLDCGRKAVSSELVPPQLRGWPQARVRGVAEEHCIVELGAGAGLRLGEKIELVHGYAPTGVNLHDAYLVLERDTVVDVWPVNPRGSGPPAFV